MAEKQKLVVTEEQQSKIIDIVAQVVSWGVAGIAIVGGIILMILQACNEDSWPHGLIAGAITLAFGTVIFIVDRTFWYLRKKLKAKKGKQENEPC